DVRINVETSSPTSASSVKEAGSTQGGVQEVDVPNDVVTSYLLMAVLWKVLEIVRGSAQAVWSEDVFLTM
ncbi:hypothetical protein L195_g057614, partial [Trifolium pratense]